MLLIQTRIKVEHSNKCCNSMVSLFVCRCDWRGLLLFDSILRNNSWLSASSDSAYASGLAANKSQDVAHSSKVSLRFQSTRFVSHLGGDFENTRRRMFHSHWSPEIVEARVLSRNRRPVNKYIFHFNHCYYSNIIYDSWVNNWI